MESNTTETPGDPKPKSSFWPSKEDMYRQKWAYLVTILAIAGSAMSVAYWNKVETDREASMRRYSSGFQFEETDEPLGVPTALASSEPHASNE